VERTGLEFAQRLGVSEKAIRKLLGPSKGEDLEQLSLVRTVRLRGGEPPPQLTSSVLSGAVIEESATLTSSRQDPVAHPIQLEEHTEEPEPVPMSLDHDASDRTFDRQMAYLGLLDDAAPMFRDGSQVPSVKQSLRSECSDVIKLQSGSSPTTQPRARLPASVLNAAITICGIELAHRIRRIFPRPSNVGSSKFSPSFYSPIGRGRIELRPPSPRYLPSLL
jgi:hypothetical protein